MREARANHAVSDVQSADFSQSCGGGVSDQNQSYCVDLYLSSEA